MSKPSPGGPSLGDENHFDFVIGSALGWWNKVEENLGDVFCALLGGINNAPARAAYCAVIAFNARLAMTHAAAASSLAGTPLFDEWVKLHNKLDDKSDIRNRITHFSRLRQKNRKGEEIVYLLPTFWKTDEWVAAVSGKGVRYDWPQVWAFGQSFGQLAIKLSVFAREVEAQLKVLREASP